MSWGAKRDGQGVNYRNILEQSSYDRATAYGPAKYQPSTDCPCITEPRNFEEVFTISTKGSAHEIRTGSLDKSPRYKGIHQDLLIRHCETIVHKQKKLVRGRDKVIKSWRRAGTGDSQIIDCWWCISLLAIAPKATEKGVWKSLSWTK